MKIEKVNDHQIRCTLTKADLADRELKISELAYGTEKAKSLFRDMMQQAAIKFGFEAEDIPLMIEAIPLNSDCIVLIITKVEDPEELDTRFSKFAPSVHEDTENYDDHAEGTVAELSNINDDVLDLFRKIKNKAIENNTEKKEGSLNASSEAQVSAKSEEKTSPSQAPATNSTRIFAFTSLYHITKPAKQINSFYNGESTLYKDNRNDVYLLVLHKSSSEAESFNKACNMFSEYGRLVKTNVSGEAFYHEHYEKICGPDAVSKLAF